MIRLAIAAFAFALVATPAAAQMTVTRDDKGREVFIHPSRRHDDRSRSIWLRNRNANFEETENEEAARHLDG